MTWVAFIILAIYLGLIFHFLSGMRKVSTAVRAESSEDFTFTLIIPFRNEVNNIETLLHSLQAFSKEANLKITLVNDHSEDNGLQIAELHFREYGRGNITVLTLPEHISGKKAALDYGIEKSSGEIIIQSDADVTLPETWFRQIESIFTASETDMLVLPVEYERGSNLFEAFQRIEFRALQAVTFGALGKEMPLMCNAANLAYRRSLYKEYRDSEYGRDADSGDDIFLLHFAAEQSKNIKHLVSRSVLAKTKALPGINDWLAQRARWAGKTQNVEDHFYLLTAWVTLITNLMICLMLIVSIKHWFWMILLKSATDYLLIKKYSRFLSLNVKPLLFMLFSVIYPPMTLLAGVMSMFHRPKWKDRPIKSPL
jgi:biofilm PGA synthesis N-glycosyltransferase PgaC